MIIESLLKVILGASVMTMLMSAVREASPSMSNLSLSLTVTGDATLRYRSLIFTGSSPTTIGSPCPGQ